MSLPFGTFVLVPLPEPLEAFVAERMDGLDQLRPATKSLVRKWKNAFTHDLERDGLVLPTPLVQLALTYSHLQATHVASWFSQCLGCDAQLLGADEVVIQFPDVQWLRHTDQESELRKLFIAMQDTVSRQLVCE